MSISILYSYKNSHHTLTTIFYLYKKIAMTGWRVGDLAILPPSLQSAPCLRGPLAACGLTACRLTACRLAACSPGDVPTWRRAHLPTCPPGDGLTCRRYNSPDETSVRSAWLQINWTACRFPSSIDIDGGTHSIS